MRILFVCTGNLCRSPLAERLASAWARESLTGSPELDRVVVLSAGMAAAEDQPMDPDAAAALRALGGDPTGFRSRAFTPQLAEDADLVLTMTREHRRAVLERTPRGLRRTFTLLEAADLLGRTPVGDLAQTGLGDRARELACRLDASRVHRRVSEADDVRDPLGRGAAVHRDVAGAVATALRPLCDVLFASVRAQLAPLLPT